MAIEYFGNKSWLDISREERMFCAHLYKELLASSGNGELSEFVNWLNDKRPRENQINVEGPWEIGFEVCFYRDVFKKQNGSLRGLNKSQEKYWFSTKRTFDLCLFSPREFIVFEAKAESETKKNDKQLKDINGDFSKSGEQTEVKLEKNKTEDAGKTAMRRTGLSNFFDYLKFKILSFIRRGVPILSGRGGRSNQA